MRLLHLLVGQDLLQGPGQKHVFRLLPFIHGRDRAVRGGGGGWSGEVRAGHRPLPPGALPGAAAAAGEGLPRRASQHPLGGSPGGGWGGPGRHRQPTPAAEGRRSLLLPSPPTPDACVRGRRPSVPEPPPARTRLHQHRRRRPQQQPALAMLEGSDVRAAAGAGGSGGRVPGGRAGGGKLEGGGHSPSARPAAVLQVEGSRGKQQGGRHGDGRCHLGAG